MHIAKKNSDISKKNTGEKQIIRDKREANFDLLRIVATLAVIMIHCSGLYVTASKSEVMATQYDVMHMEIVWAYNTISRFAVPCFVMMSGAFALADERNRNYKYFYKKTFRKIWVPTIVVSLAYVLLSEVIFLRQIIMGSSEWSKLLLPWENLLIGAPFYHMWYMYMMIGVYLLTPIIIQVKKDLGDKHFEIMAWIFLILAMLSASTSTQTFKWDIGSAFCYVGYFMIGHVLKSRCKKNNLTGLLLIMLGFGIGVIITLCQQWQREGIQIISGLNYNIFSCGTWGPLLLLYSLFIFAGFSKLVVKGDFSKISTMTFLIYLLHGGILDVWNDIIVKIFGAKVHAGISIFISIVVVFCLSLVAAKIYQIVWNKIEQKYGVSDRFCKKIFKE